MKNFILALAFLAGIGLLPHHVTASTEAEKKEYILTFPSINQAAEYADLYQFQQFGPYVKAHLSAYDIVSLKEENPLTLIDQNYVKEADAIGPDPLRESQWSLNPIGFASIRKQYPQPPVNLLIGSYMTSEDQSFTYMGQPVPFQQFSISVQKPIRRISVQIANLQGNWTLEARDQSGSLLGKTTSSYSQNDILLKAPIASGNLSLKVDSDNGWIPAISNVIGVNHSIVAVIDTGAVQHEDFGSNILFSIGKDFVEGDSIPQDENGHGTHITGIIAASAYNNIGVTGVVGNGPVDVIPLRALDGNGRGSDFNLSLALKEAIYLGADVINLSFSGKGKTTMLENAIYEAYKNNIIVVAAAGNNSSTTESIYPASYPGVITVIGTDPSAKKLPNSNFGYEAEVTAPGTNILSTYPQNQYKELTGTSMAAPMVSGILALYESRYGDMDWLQAQELIEYSSKDLFTPGYDPTTGFGLIQYNPYLPPPSRTVGWLNLKPGGSLVETKQMIGFSPSMIKQKVTVFIDDQLYISKTINDILVDLNLPSSILDGKRHSLLAIVTSGDKVAGKHFLQVNSDQATPTFFDVSSSYWAYQDIKTATTNGWINGYDGEAFKPSDSITRRHSLMILNRMMGWYAPETITNPFTDVPATLPGYLSILAGQEKGLIKGYLDGTFRGENELLRGQMAIILTRLLNGEVPEYMEEFHPFQDLQNNSEEFRAVQWLTSKGIFKKQNKFNPFEPMTRAQFAAVLVRVSKQFYE